jgi:hypothetical protein
MCVRLVKSTKFVPKQVQKNIFFLSFLLEIYTDFQSLICSPHYRNNFHLAFLIQCPALDMVSSSSFNYQFGKITSIVSIRPYLLSKDLLIGSWKFSMYQKLYLRSKRITRLRLPSLLGITA